LHFLNAVYDIDKVLFSTYKNFLFEQMQAAESPAAMRSFLIR